MCHAADTKKSLETTKRTTKKGQNFFFCNEGGETGNLFQSCGGQRGADNSSVPTNRVSEVVLDLEGLAFVSRSLTYQVVERRNEFRMKFGKHIESRISSFLVRGFKKYIRTT